MPSGRLADPDVASLQGLGQLLRRRLGRDLAPAAAFAADSADPGHPAENARAGTAGYWRAAPGRDTARLTLHFAEPAAVRYLSLREELTVGQRVEAGRVLADGREAARFTVVGARRICDLGPGITCRTLTVCLDACRAEPTLREICVY